MHWYAVYAAEQSAMLPALATVMQPDCSALARVPQQVVSCAHVAMVLPPLDPPLDPPLEPPLEPPLLPPLEPPLPPPELPPLLHCDAQFMVSHVVRACPAD
jgi:hypothetical protein